MTATAYERVVKRLEEVTGYGPRGENGHQAMRCPAHDDRSPSLTVTRGDDRVLITCHAGCDYRAVLAALDLPESALFDEPKAPRVNPQVVARYVYTDENGQPVERKLRYEPGFDDAKKSFSLQRPDGRGGWVKGGASTHVLYRLPDVLAAIASGRTVYICEGEKDCEAAERAGVVATCNIEGASKAGMRPKWRPEYSAALKGARVVVVADRDEAGYAHARHIAESLRPVAASVDLRQARTGKDLAEHLGAGHTLDELVPVADGAGDAVDDRVAEEDVVRSRTISGAAWILDEPDDIPAVWGAREEILWSRGESLMLVGPSGVGKTTIGQQLVLALLGVRPPELLGYPVAALDAAQKVLYVAGDRPRQAARSFKRMVSETDRQVLDERLVVWRGPLPFDITKEPEKLAQFCLERDAAVVIIDSLKDVARKFTDDESGATINSALQTVLVNDIEVVVLHHQRKAVGDNKKPKTLADVYGSVWITAGAGSVVLVWGEPGDSCVELSHLKQPAADVGPLNAIHDHRTGTTDLEGRFDLLQFMRQRRHGVTAADVAKARFNTTNPKPNQIEKARRNIADAVNRGHVVQISEPAKGGPGGSRGAVYGLVDPAEKLAPGASTRASTVIHAHPHEHPRASTNDPETIHTAPTGGIHGPPLIRGGRSVTEQRATSTDYENEPF